MPRICVEDLFVRRVCRCADSVSIGGCGKVFDVIQYYISWLSLILMVLSASQGGNMRRNASIYGYDIFSIVLSNRQPSKHFEAMPFMQFSGDLTQYRRQPWERERFCCDET